MSSSQSPCNVWSGWSVPWPSLFDTVSLQQESCSSHIIRICFPNIPSFFPAGLHCFVLSHATLTLLLPALILMQWQVFQVLNSLSLFTLMISDTEEGDWCNLPSQSSMKPPNWGNMRIPWRFLFLCMKSCTGDISCWSRQHRYSSTARRHTQQW